MVDGIPVWPIFGSSSNGQLYPEHLDMLARSGISPEFAAQRGYETVVNATCLKALGLAKAAQKLVPGVMFPLLRADESGRAGSTGPTTRECATANWPNTKCPWASATSSTCRPVSGGWLSDAAYDLWITEGTKKG